jgi:L-threonylcarbamoyladenylate synthase
MDAEALCAAIAALGPPGSGPSLAVYSLCVCPQRPDLLQRRMPADAAAAAHELFAVLRGFDDAGVQQIWVETPPAGAEWDGVRDRLQRAAA